MVVSLPHTQEVIIRGYPVYLMTPDNIAILTLNVAL